MNFGILPNVNFTKQKRDVKLGIGVCSRIIRLTNNQTKRLKRDTIPTKEEKKRRQNCCSYCENCTTVGLCLVRCDCKTQQRCARSKAWDLAENMNKLTEKDKTTFYSPSEEWVLPVTSIQEPEEREFVVDSGAGMLMVSKKDLNSCRVGDHEDIEESHDGDDRQRRGANQRRSHGICQRIGLTGWCFSELGDGYAS